MKWRSRQAQTSPSRVLFLVRVPRIAQQSVELSRSTIRARGGAFLEVRRRRRNRGHGVELALAPVGVRDHRLWTTDTLIVAARLWCGRAAGYGAPWNGL